VKILENNIAPEIQASAQQIVKTVFGERAKVNSFEWSTGGLFNKIFKINTTEGDFILKMECDEIFFATRKEQIENEVYGNELFRRFGIPCPKILAHEFTKNGVGTRYVFMEHIKNEGNDCPLHGTIDRFDESIKAEIERQFLAVFVKMREMTSTQFGGVSPTSILGRHEGYDGFYRSTLNLLIKDSENCGVFTGEELDIVKKPRKNRWSMRRNMSPRSYTAIWDTTTPSGEAQTAAGIIYTSLISGTRSTDFRILRNTSAKCMARTPISSKR